MNVFTSPFQITYLVSVRKRRIESAADIESKKRVLATVYVIYLFI